MIYILLFLSVFLGASVVFFIKLNKHYTKLLLAFSGAFLLAIVVFHLLPEVYSSISDAKKIGVFIAFGMFVQMILEFFSNGVEHGHVHNHNHKNTIPISLLLSLFLHAFIEGMPITSYDNSFLFGIVIHKLPIAIVVTTFLLTSNVSKIKTLGLLLFFALMAPLGSFVGENVAFLHENHQYIAAIVIGMLTHVSTTILYESSENHKFNLLKFSIVLLAFSIAYFI